MEVPKCMIDITDHKDGCVQLKKLITYHKEQVQEILEKPRWTSNRRDLIKILCDYSFLRRIFNTYKRTYYGDVFLELIKKGYSPGRLSIKWFGPAKMLAICRKIYEKDIKKLEITHENIHNESLFISKNKHLQDKLPANIFLTYKEKHRDMFEKDKLLIRIGKNQDNNMYFLPFVLVNRLLTKFPDSRKQKLIKQLKDFSINEFRFLLFISLNEKAFTKDGVSQAELQPFFDEIKIKFYNNTVLLMSLLDKKILYRFYKKEKGLKPYYCLVKPSGRTSQESAPSNKMIVKIIGNYYDKYHKAIDHNILLKEFDEYSRYTINPIILDLEKRGFIWIRGTSGRPREYLPRCANPVEGFPFKHQRTLREKKKYPHEKLLKVYLTLAKKGNILTTTEISEETGLSEGTLKQEYLKYLRKEDIIERKYKYRNSAPYFSVLDAEDYAFAMYYFKEVLDVFETKMNAELKLLDDRFTKNAIFVRKKPEPRYWIILERTRKTLGKYAKNKNGIKLFALEPILLLLKERVAESKNNQERDINFLLKYKKVLKEDAATSKNKIMKYIPDIKKYKITNRYEFLNQLFWNAKLRKAGITDMDQMYIRLEKIKDLLSQEIQIILNNVEYSKEDKKKLLN